MSWTEELRALCREVRGIKSGRSELRSFGLLMAAALLVFAGLAWWKGSPSVIGLGVAAAILLLPALAFPRILWPLHKIWMALALPLGWVMTRLILSLVFLFTLTPIALVGRLFRKSFLDLSMDEKRNSYWEQRDKKVRSIQDYRKQF